MDITIASSLRPFVENKLSSGAFGSPSELVNYALDRLREEEARLQTLRGEIQRGVDSLERGEGAPWNLEDCRAQLTQRAGRKQGE